MQAPTDSLESIAQVDHERRRDAGHAETERQTKGESQPRLPFRSQDVDRSAEQDDRGEKQGGELQQERDAEGEPEDRGAQHGSAVEVPPERIDGRGEAEGAGDVRGHEVTVREERWREHEEQQSDQRRRLAVERESEAADQRAEQDAHHNHDASRAHEDRLVRIEVSIHEFQAHAPVIHVEGRSDHVRARRDCQCGKHPRERRIDGVRCEVPLTDHVEADRQVDELVDRHRVFAGGHAGLHGEKHEEQPDERSSDHGRGSAAGIS